MVLPKWATPSSFPISLALLLSKHLISRYFCCFSNISLAQLFEKIGENSADSYPMKCYELLATKSKPEQEHLYKILVEIDKYKNY